MPIRSNQAAVAALALLVGGSDAFSFSPRRNSAGAASRGQDPIRLWAAPENGEPVLAQSNAKEVDMEEAIFEASDALGAVGWSSPLQDEEFTSDDPFVRRIDEEVRKESGVGLDELLNPAKVVNLERDLFNLRSELAFLTGKGGVDATGLTEECDGGGGEEADDIRANISKKEKSLIVEKRAVFRGWLKNVFLGQAILSLGLSWVMVSNPGSLFGGFDWFNLYSM